MPSWILLIITHTSLLEGLESTRPPVCDDTSTSDEGLESTRPPVYSDTSASDESRSVNLLFLFDQDKVILKHLQGGSYYRWPPGRPMVTFQFSWYKIVNAKVEHNPSSTSLHSHLRWDAGPLYNQYQSTLQEQVFTVSILGRGANIASKILTSGRRFKQSIGATGMPVPLGRILQTNNTGRCSL